MISHFIHLLLSCDFYCWNPLCIQWTNLGQALGRQEQPFVNRVCWNLNTLRKSPIVRFAFNDAQCMCMNVRAVWVQLGIILAGRGNAKGRVNLPCILHPREETIVSRLASIFIFTRYRIHIDAQYFWSAITRCKEQWSRLKCKKRVMWKRIFHMLTQARAVYTLTEKTSLTLAIDNLSPVGTFRLPPLLRPSSSIQKKSIVTGRVFQKGRHSALRWWETQWIHMARITLGHSQH